MAKRQTRQTKDYKRDPRRGLKIKKGKQMLKRGVLVGVGAKQRETKT